MEKEKEPILAKYNKKENCMYCPECKTYNVMCDATGTYRLPIGFGFLPNETKFGISFWELSGYWGECEICNNRIFNYTKKRKITRYPNSINKKIKNLPR